MKHAEPNFARNFIDQDGEAFEPWIPDGLSDEFTHYFNLKKELPYGLLLDVETYNSVIGFSPTGFRQANPVYIQNVNETWKPMFVYHWQSEAFTSGLLENRARLSYNRKITPKINMQSNADLTFDGILLGDKSIFRINWQAEANFDYRPNKWFALGLNLARKRVAFNYDHIRFLSDSYLNGTLYYWQYANGNQAFDNGEGTDLLMYTGGEQHSVAGGLQQQYYYLLNIPLKFTFGNHQLVFHNRYKKYNNPWMERNAEDASNYG